jgi:hypothetical protein
VPCSEQPFTRCAICPRPFRYKDPADRARYAAWTPAECRRHECLGVHAAAGLEADLVAISGLVAAKLPGLLRGASVEELLEPWPSAEE